MAAVRLSTAAGRLTVHWSRAAFSAYSAPIYRRIYTNKQLNDAIPVLLPALSPTMKTGTILQWKKKEGDTVSPGDVLCDMKTDKADMAIETEEEGIMAKILVPENTEEVNVGTLICVLVEEGDDWQSVAVPSGYPLHGDAPSASQPAEAESQTSSSQQSSTDSHSTSHVYGPAVRALFEQYNISVNDVAGTGPHGRILKGDVLKHIHSKNLQPVAPASVPPPAQMAAPVIPSQPSIQDEAPVTTAKPTRAAALSEVDEGFTDIPTTNIRAVIAKRLTESKTTVPHSYGSIDCNMKQVIDLRKQLKAEGTKVSVNDFIIKAAAVALQRLPEVNAVWAGDAPRLLSDIDISVAVATENGLITPIVTDAIGKGVAEISETIKELAGRARIGKLQLHEFQGGSFTISNLGMFGITEFSAVINPPQACILAIGTSRLTLDEDGQPQPKMAVTLSSDARIVDDVLASRFLEVFQEVMENPMLMLSQSPSVNINKLFAK